MVGYKIQTKTLGAGKEKESDTGDRRASGRGRGANPSYGKELSSHEGGEGLDAYTHAAKKRHQAHTTSSEGKVIRGERRGRGGLSSSRNQSKQKGFGG